MKAIQLLVTVFLLVLILSACTTTPVVERARVHCPACDHEFDALFEKHF